jgi:hypothetical protein
MFKFAVNKIYMRKFLYNFLLSRDLNVGCDTQLMNMRKNKIFVASTQISGLQGRYYQTQQVTPIPLLLFRHNEDLPVPLKISDRILFFLLGRKLKKLLSNSRYVIH